MADDLAGAAVLAVAPLGWRAGRRGLVLRVLRVLRVLCVLRVAVLAVVGVRAVRADRHSTSSIDSRMCGPHEEGIEKKGRAPQQF